MSSNRIDLSPELLDALQNVSELVVEGEGSGPTLERIVEVACKTLPGCDGAGMSLLEGDKFTTPTASNDWALAIDQVQYDKNEGPCIEAGLSSKVLEMKNASSDERWPGFTSQAKQQGLGSSLSFPLGGGVGALNIYSRSEDSFDSADHALGELLAAQATTAIKNAQLYATARSLANGLSIALGTRDLIGQAKGILMEREDIDEDAAFEMLRTISQQANMKLRDVAHNVVHNKTMKRRRPRLGVGDRT